MKMKHFKWFLSLLFSLSLVFACDVGGIKPSNNPTTPSVVKFKITFNATDLSCEKGSTGGEVFVSGSEIEEGKELKFSAILIEGETLANWYVNDNKKESATKKDFVYKVVATDADSNKVINISYASNTLKLTFDATQIKCKKGYSGSGDEITSGTKVKADEYYKFTPLITEDEIVDAWYAGQRKINFSPSRDPEGYTVRKGDADDKNIIHIRYEKREIKKYTLQFDSTITCKKGFGGTGGAVLSGVEVRENEYYKFTAVGLGEDESYKFTAVLGTGEKVRHWLINGESRTYETSETFSYTVRKNEVAENAQTITISFEKQ